MQFSIKLTIALLNLAISCQSFQTYINNSDKQFVASTIQAIGRCASNIPEVTDTCLSGLVKLLSNRDGERHIRNTQLFGNRTTVLMHAFAIVPIPAVVIHIFQLARCG